MFSIALLISGTGSNLKAIHQAILNKQLAASIAVVISNRADTAGLIYPQDAGIPIHVIQNQDYPDRMHYDQALKPMLRKLSASFNRTGGVYADLKSRIRATLIMGV